MGGGFKYTEAYLNIMAKQGRLSKLLGRKPIIAQETAMSVGNRKAMPSEVFAGLSDVLLSTDDLTRSARARSSYDQFDQTFDLFDSMVKLDPELNGAVRSVSLTANNYLIDYKGAKNATIRNAIKELVERIDFDDILISALRNLMVYGNDINKLVGRAGEGITKIQSLPAKQVTIMDKRVDIRELSSSGYTGQITEDNPVMDANYYLFRENKVATQVFSASEIWHIKIDFRSNWFRDRLGRWTYGVWGASRFSSLKQPIRAKYNSINNRVALEDSLTKQYITIGMEAVEHITDPAEQQERLKAIMNDVAKMLETLDGDQIPIIPDYVQINHVDLRNAIPDASAFLDSVNADISAVLHVPRTAAGQERGSTFAATFNANVWAVSAISRLQNVLAQAVHEMFSQHLKLKGIAHKNIDIPQLTFKPLDEETPTNMMRRATQGWDSGLLSLDQALEIIELKDDKKPRKDTNPQKSEPDGPMPREKEVENNSKPKTDSKDKSDNKSKSTDN